MQAKIPAYVRVYNALKTRILEGITQLANFCRRNRNWKNSSA